MPDLRRNSSAFLGPLNIGSTRIADALAGSVDLDDSTLAKARAAVCDYVHVQHAAGMPPESVIAHVKTLVQASYPADTPLEVREALMANVVEWCIETYYGTTPMDRLVDQSRPARADS